MVQDIVYSSVVAQEVDNGKAIITFFINVSSLCSGWFYHWGCPGKKMLWFKILYFFRVGVLLCMFVSKTSLMLSFMSVMLLITWTPYMPMNPSATILHHLDAEIPLDDGIWSDDN